MRTKKMRGGLFDWMRSSKPKTKIIDTIHNPIVDTNTIPEKFADGDIYSEYCNYKRDANEVVTGKNFKLPERAIVKDRQINDDILVGEERNKCNEAVDNAIDEVDVPDDTEIINEGLKKKTPSLFKRTEIKRQKLNQTLQPTFNKINSTVNNTKSWWPFGGGKSRKRLKRKLKERRRKSRKVFKRK